MYADSNFGQLSVRNLIIDVILLLLSGSEIHSTNFTKNLPKSMFVRN